MENPTQRKKKSQEFFLNETVLLSLSRESNCKFVTKMSADGMDSHPQIIGNPDLNLVYRMQRLVWDALKIEDRGLSGSERMEHQETWLRKHADSKKVFQDLAWLQSADFSTVFSGNLFTKLVLDVCDIIRAMPEQQWEPPQPSAKPAPKKLVDKQLAEKQLQKMRTQILLSTLLTQAHRAEFKKILSQATKSVIKNHRSVEKYFDALFKIYPEMATYYMELGINYKVESGTNAPNTAPHPTTSELPSSQLLRDKFKVLMNRRRGRALFNGMMGYVAKLDYFPSVGYYYRILFVFDANQHTPCFEHFKSMGEYWRDTASPENKKFSQPNNLVPSPEAKAVYVGTYSHQGICNLTQDKSWYKGYCLIAKEEGNQKGSLFADILPFFARSELFASVLNRAGDDEKFRTFLHGEMPTPSSRPVRNKQSVQA